MQSWPRKRINLRMRPPTLDSRAGCTTLVSRISTITESWSPTPLWTVFRQLINPCAWTILQLVDRMNTIMKQTKGRQLARYETANWTGLEPSCGFRSIPVYLSPLLNTGDNCLIHGLTRPVWFKTWATSREKPCTKRDPKYDRQHQKTMWSLQNILQGGTNGDSS